MPAKRKKNLYFPKFFLTHKRKLLKTIVPSFINHKKNFASHKIKNEPHFFQKIKHKDLVLLIKSFLNFTDITKIYFEVTIPGFNDVIEKETSKWIKDRNVLQKKENITLWNPLMINDSKNVLDYSFKNFNLNNKALPQKTKFFISDSSNGKLYSLSSHFLSVQEDNKPIISYEIKETYISHFQLLPEYNKNVIAYFTLDDVIFYDFEKEETILILNFSSQFIFYNPFLDLFIFISDINGNILVFDRNKKQKNIFSLYENDATGLDLFSYDKNMFCFYSCDEKDKKVIYIMNLKKKEIIFTFTKKNKSQFRNVAYHDKYIIGIDNESIYHWSLDSFSLFSVFHLNLLGKEIETNIISIDALLLNIFVIFYCDDCRRLYNAFLFINHHSKTKFLILSNEPIACFPQNQNSFFHFVLKDKKESMINYCIYFTDNKLEKSTKFTKVSYLLHI